MTPNATYTICVTPKMVGLKLAYEMLLVRDIEGGTSGPFSEKSTVAANGWDDPFVNVDNKLGSWGYKRDGAFGEINANGFATAKVVPL